MKIKTTRHFDLRVADRMNYNKSNPRETIIKHFKEAVKLISKKKIHPYFKDPCPNGYMYGVNYHSINFIYVKK